MYRNSYQRGLLTIFFGGGANPLSIWETTIKDGYITRFLDQEIKSMVLEIRGNNVTTTYITCPKGKQVLGIAMPFLVMVVRNLKRYFTFEVTILDDTGTRRRFRVSNFQSTTQILPLCTVMPIALSDGWNQIQFNLAEFTRRAYKKQFIEVQKVKINANIRIRRIYFAERLLPEDQLPAEYKFFLPISSKGAKKPVKEGAKAEQRVSVSSVKKVPSIDKGEVAGGDTEPQPGEEMAKEAVGEEESPKLEAIPTGGEGEAAGEAVPEEKIEGALEGAEVAAEVEGAAAEGVEGGSPGAERAVDADAEAKEEGPAGAKVAEEGGVAASPEPEQMVVTEVTETDEDAAEEPAAVAEEA